MLYNISLCRYFREVVGVNVGILCASWQMMWHGLKVEVLS